MLGRTQSRSTRRRLPGSTASRQPARPGTTSTSVVPVARFLRGHVRKRRLVGAKGRARATAPPCSSRPRSSTPMQTEFHSIDELLAVMVERNASDLHLTVGSPPVIRVRGRLERLPDHEALTPDEIRTLMYRILSTEQQKTLETRRQIDFSHSIPGLARFRVNAYFQRAAVGAAFRLIPDKIKTLEELGLPTRLYELADKPRGLVLVTGPTGSGKSTTLASLLDHVNRSRHEHILTIEDPIEFLHHHGTCIVN